MLNRKTLLFEGILWTPLLIIFHPAKGNNHLLYFVNAILIESRMANRYILDLRENVKRGTDNKLQKG
jgi:hypothetical protein